MNDIAALHPTRLVGVRETFGIDADLQVPAFAERDAHVPEIDAVYRFNPDVTLAILAGFMRDRRVMVQGLHGTCLLYTSPSPRDLSTSRMPSSA